MRILLGIIVGVFCACCCGLMLASDTPNFAASYLPPLTGGVAGGYLARRSGVLVRLLVSGLEFGLALGGLIWMVMIPNGLPITASVVDWLLLLTCLAVGALSGLVGERCHRRYPLQLRVWPPQLLVSQE